MLARHIPVPQLEAVAAATELRIVDTQDLDDGVVFGLKPDGLSWRMLTDDPLGRSFVDQTCRHGYHEFVRRAVRRCPHGTVELLPGQPITVLNVESALGLAERAYLDSFAGRHGRCGCV